MEIKIPSMHKYKLSNVSIDETKTIFLFDICSLLYLHFFIFTIISIVSKLLGTYLQFLI